MLCEELQYRDWVTDEHGLPMQITNVGEDYAYATFEGNDVGPWEFDNKDAQPKPIPLTPEILEKNGWWYAIEGLWLHDGVSFSIEEWNGKFQCYDIRQIKLYSVHQLQHALRLCGLDELADNFKVMEE